MKESQEYIEQILNPILEPLVNELVKVKPLNPIPFMLDWLQIRNVESMQGVLPAKLPNATGIQKLSQKAGNEEIRSCESSDDNNSSFEVLLRLLIGMQS